MADQPKHRNTREALIQAGINEINEYGVANLSMRRIAKACGCLLYTSPSPRDRG